MRQMRRPARIKEWMSIDEMMVWVEEAKSKQEYKRRLSIWLTYIGPFFAHEVAKMLQVSTPTVWLWIKQYNKLGPEGLGRKGRGGRRRSYLSWEQEEALLDSFVERARNGEIVTAKHIHSEVCEVVGKAVSIDYVYRLMYRHRWRKLGPRPHHIKREKKIQEEFKKNSQRLSEKK